MQTAAELAPPASSGYSSKPELFSSGGKRSFILSLILVLVTLATYNSLAHNGFINLDDNLYVTQNEHVQSGVHWSTVKWALTSEDQANWHPLTWLSHALDWELFGKNAGGHHYVSLLFHACNAVLLFLLLQAATGFTWRSLMVAALFALHPINVESVAWVAERKTVLSMLFFLLALAAYDRYARKRGIPGYLMVALWFALGLMAKPMVITFPLVLLLWDYWPLRRMFPAPDELQLGPAGATAQPFSWLFLEKLPLLLLSAASALITMKAQSAGGAVRSMMEYSFRVRLQNAVVAYARYVGKAFWPWPLAPLYPHPGNTLKRWEVVAASLFLLAVTALVLLARRQRYLATGWFWFLGTLVPMIGLVQVGAAAMADRYAYLPFIGLFIMICWGIAEWAERRQISPRWLAAPSFAVLIALSAVTYRQLSYWRDNVLLWSH